MYGWYSQKQYDLCGGIFYSNESGDEVLVTAVTQEPTHEMGWDDVRSLGLVIKYVRDAGRIRYVKESFYRC